MTLAQRPVAQSEPTARDWFRIWKDTYGEFPNHCLVVDVETTGLEANRDLIVQLGWCEVKDRVVVENDGSVLDWTSHPEIDQRWLNDRLESTRRAMFSRGSGYAWDMEVLSKGRPPLDVLATLLVRLRDPYVPMLVTHNGWSFDVPMLESHFRQFLFQEYKFQPQAMWDTGCMEKAQQLNLTPHRGETPRDFAKRVMSIRSRTKWSLATHCIARYNLDLKHGLDMMRAHTAPFDCLVTHLLLDTYRETLEGKESEPCGSAPQPATSLT